MTAWLVTGATGLLGSNAALTLGETGTAVGTSRRVPLASPVPFIRSELQSASSRRDLVARSGATAVFHAAAVSSIEACESDPLLARELNVTAAVDLALQARDAGAAFVYISTDAVFDGIGGGYAESSPTSPVSEYGRTKVDGEKAVLDAYPEALVARVNFYGWSPTAQRSIAEFFYHALKEGRSVNGFTDIVVSTLQVSYLVESIEELVSKNARGIIHVASTESISKFDFGRSLAAEFGFDPRLVVQAVSTDHLKHRRGSNLSMQSSAAEAILGRPMPTQASGLDRLRSELRAGRARDVIQFNPTIGS